MSNSAKYADEPTTLEIINFLLGENYAGLHDIPVIELQMVCNAMSKWLQILESQNTGLQEMEQSNGQ